MARIRALCAGLSSLLLAGRTTPRPAGHEPADPKPVADSEAVSEAAYTGLLIAGIRAFEMEDELVAAAASEAALRLRPRDDLAHDLLEASRRARHGGGSLVRAPYLAEKRQEFAARRAGLAVANVASGPGSEGAYIELIVAAIDAFCREEYEAAEANAQAALWLRPDDELASDLLMDSRRARHCGGDLYWREQKERYRQIRDAVRPPAPP